MKAKPASNKIVSSITLNDMPADEFRAWYRKQSYFNSCQLQDAYGYSSAAGLLQGMTRETFVVQVDDCGNIFPVI